MLTANNYFAGITAIITLVWITVLLGYNLQRLCGRNPLLIQAWLQNAILYATIVMFLIMLFLNTFWFYRTLWLWLYNSVECRAGWNQLDSLNFILIICYTALFAVITTLFLLLCICTSPCWIKECRKYRDEQRAQDQEKDTAISSVVKFFYDPEKYKLADTCAICLGDFEPN